MKNVRKDVIEKLLKKYRELKAKNPQQGGYRYSTPRADHWLVIIDGKFCFTTKQYDGTYCHTELSISE